MRRTRPNTFYVRFSTCSLDHLPPLLQLSQYSPSRDFVTKFPNSWRSMTVRFMKFRFQLRTVSSCLKSLRKTWEMDFQISIYLKSFIIPIIYGYAMTSAVAHCTRFPGHWRILESCSQRVRETDDITPDSPRRHPSNLQDIPGLDMSIRSDCFCAEKSRNGH